MSEKTYLGNAFSLQMLDTNVPSNISITPVTADEVAKADFVSAIGHEDTAHVVSNILKRDVPFNRISVRLEVNDVLYVAQVVGGRLPEGATTLPEGFALSFLKVQIL